MKTRFLVPIATKIKCTPEFMSTRNSGLPNGYATTAPSTTRTEIVIGNVLMFL